MSERILGLSVRWRAPFDERFYGRLRPALLGDLVVARAGDRLVAVDRRDGRRAWAVSVEREGGGGSFVEAIGDVAVTDRRDPSTKRSHLVAVTAGGAAAWDRELSGNIGRSAVRSGDRELVALVLDAPHQLVRVEPAGGLDVVGLPHPGTSVARAGDGWVIGRAGPAAGHPALFAWRAGAATAARDAAPQVLGVHVAGDRVVTLERHDGALALVGRTPSLDVAWRVPVASDVHGADGDAVVALLGDPEAPAPARLDAATGAIRWRAAPLAGRAARVSLAGDLVAISHDDGATLLGVDGAVIGTSEHAVSPHRADGADVLLLVDRALLCLSRA